MHVMILEGNRSLATRGGSKKAVHHSGGSNSKDIDQFKQRLAGLATIINID